ncbi:hypothetical protein JHK87_014819 [Glycine soja]|nr:hypothetical protein JHK87_014819 [Glycine soja]
MAGGFDGKITLSVDISCIVAASSGLIFGYDIGVSSFLFPSSRVTAALGGRNTIMLGGVTFFAGGALNGAAENIAMLILGLIFLGLGVGVGVLAAGCINYATANQPWGWRLSLGLAVVPATDTPSSLVERVNLAPLILSTAIVDRFGQSSSSFLVPFSCLIFCQIAVSALLAMVTGVHGTKDISKGNAMLVLVLL